MCGRQARLGSRTRFPLAHSAGEDRSRRADPREGSEEGSTGGGRQEGRGEVERVRDAVEAEEGRRGEGVKGRGGGDGVRRGVVGDVGAGGLETVRTAATEASRAVGARLRVEEAVWSGEGGREGVSFAILPRIQKAFARRNSPRLTPSPSFSSVNLFLRSSTPSSKRSTTPLVALSYSSSTRSTSAS